MSKGQAKDIHCRRGEQLSVIDEVRIVVWKELEDIAQSLQNHPPPEVKVVGPQGNCQRSCYGSVSSILNTDCGHLDDTSTTNTTGVHCPNMTPSKMQRRLKPKPSEGLLT
ncbi:hypothetical protein E2C01_034173 [Portunus trituberculatus]|uniref:Uncharacterized protein n=1 Tax=Portunus trituberculatus TaxID=210409 RepID=A0A5B7EZV2_PORTR|nr:hypothetical protein [Portunus trituberculatus]